jgi:hypothetical protein
MANKPGGVKEVDVRNIILTENEQKKIVKGRQIRDGKNVNLTDDQKKLLKSANNQIGKARRFVNGWIPPNKNSGNNLISKAEKNGKGNTWGAGVYFKTVPIPTPVMVIRGPSGNEIMVKYWNGNDFKYFHNSNNGAYARRN